ncbi:MAG: hypothetical protein R3C11_20490 [Planctomycetaceae bacterium]
MKLTQTEDRSAGPVSPGLKVTATINLERYPAANPAVIPEDVEEIVPFQPTEEELALELMAPGILVVTVATGMSFSRQSLPPH